MSDEIASRLITVGGALLGVVVGAIINHVTTHRKEQVATRRQLKSLLIRLKTNKIQRSYGIYLRDLRTFFIHNNGLLDLIENQGFFDTWLADSETEYAVTVQTPRSILLDKLGGIV